MVRKAGFQIIHRCKRWITLEPFHHGIPVRLHVAVRVGQRQKTPARFQHAPALAQRRLEIRHVIEHVSRRDDIETRVLEWERNDIALRVVHRRMRSSSLVHHALRVIQSDDLATMP